jgi:hypothetical protein
MQNSNQIIQSIIFEVHGLTPEVYTNGIYRIDFALHKSYKWPLEHKVADLYKIHVKEALNSKNNIEYRKSANKIAHELKRQYAEYFI